MGKPGASSTRERQLMAELLHDPAFRDAREGLRGRAAGLDRESLDDPEAFVSAVRASLQQVDGLLDERPELAALIEAAECDRH